MLESPSRGLWALVHRAWGHGPERWYQQFTRPHTGPEDGPSLASSSVEFCSSWNLFFLFWPHSFPFCEGLLTSSLVRVLSTLRRRGNLPFFKCVGTVSPFPVPPLGRDPVERCLQSGKPALYSERGTASGAALGLAGWLSRPHLDSCVPGSSGFRQRRVVASPRQLLLACLSRSAHGDLQAGWWDGGRGLACVCSVDGQMGGDKWSLEADGGLSLVHVKLCFCALLH